MREKEKEFMNVFFIERKEINEKKNYFVKFSLNNICNRYGFRSILFI